MEDLERRRAERFHDILENLPEKPGELFEQLQAFSRDYQIHLHFQEEDPHWESYIFSSGRLWGDPLETSIQAICDGREVSINGFTFATTKVTV